MQISDPKTAVAAETRLSEALAQYAGEWVAVTDHQVQAHSGNLQSLIANVDMTKVDRVQQVPKHPGVACFY